MKRIVVAATILALVTTGLAFADAKPAAECSCTQGRSSQPVELGPRDLTP